MVVEAYKSYLQICSEIIGTTVPAIRLLLTVLAGMCYILIINIQKSLINVVLLSAYITCII